jgi:gamma-glutamyl-gamma-aminobutyrate hydrolase PuuD
MKSPVKYIFFTFVACLSLTHINAQNITNDTATSKLQLLYQQIEQKMTTSKRIKNQPLIGISTYHSIHRDSGAHNTYVNAVIKAGGIPVLVPLTDNSVVLHQILSRLDGIIITGGDDLDTSFYGEQPIPQMGAVDSLRDVYDLTLIKLAADLRMPLLGICRGIQLINVAFGGTLYQDLPTQHPSDIAHHQTEPSDIGTHDITIVPKTRLSRILPNSIYKVNSFHHQAVKQVAPGLKVSAYTADQVVEGLESSPKQNIIAVQFHPECLIMNGDMTTLPIFKDLIKRAMKYHKH